MEYSIRDATTADLGTVLALNQSEVPHVGSMTMQDMHDFLAKAVYFRVACDPDDDVLGVLIGLAPGTKYASLNYQWFSERYDAFAYIDRIMVATRARRQGLAEALYADFERASSNWAPLMCCEVNLVPENPASMAFHQRLGYSRAGELETLGGAKKVAMLIKEIG